MYQTEFKPKEKRAIYAKIFIHTHKYSKAFTTPTFVKLIKAELHQVGIFYTEFRPNRS